MHIEIVSSDRRLEGVGPAWDALWAQGGGTVFQSHGWISAWWAAKSPSNGAKLCVGLCWKGNQLVAVMPCVTRWHRAVRVLEWAAKECSDYCDALVDRTSAEGFAALDLIWAEISKAGCFDVTYLSHVRPDAAVNVLLNDGPGRAVRLKEGHRVETSLQVRNHGMTGQAWFRALTKKARNNHTRGKRIVGESGAVTVHVYGNAEPIEPLLERMIQLKRTWLASKEQTNPILQDDAVILRALVQELERRGALKAFSMECEGALVAGSVNILNGSQMQAFFATYDPRFERASPGTLIMVEYLMWAFDHGYSEVDFLCGKEEYKYKFANAQTDLASFTGARTVLGRLAIAVSSQLDRGARRPER